MCPIVCVGRYGIGPRSDPFGRRSPASREQPHALASVLASERASRHAIARQLELTDAPVAGSRCQQASRRRKRPSATALSPRQRRAA